MNICHHGRRLDVPRSHTLGSVRVSTAAKTSECYDEAALRHFRDADHLASDRRWNSAGHLVGFAAECALKHAIASLRPGQDVPHKHFPDLLLIAKKHLQLRNHRGWHGLIERADYLEGWTVENRYAADDTVSPEMYEHWRGDATRTLGAARLRSTR